MEKAFKTRYTVTLELYVYAKNDKEAIRLAKKIEDSQRKKYNNGAVVAEIHHTPDAPLTSRKVR